MSLKSVVRGLDTLRFRLTLWYGAVFVSVLSGAFLLAYRALIGHMERSLDTAAVQRLKQHEMVYRRYGFKGLSREYAEDTQSLGSARMFCRMLDPGGFVLFSSDLATWRDLPAPPPAEVPGSGADAPLFETLTLRSKRFPVRTTWLRDRSGNVFQYGLTTGEIVLAATDYRDLLMLVGVSTLMVAVGMVYVVADRSMSALDTIREVVRKLMGGDFSPRVPELGAGQEVDALAAAFNLMAEKVGNLIRDLRETTSNIAHDLRSPLTRIRAAAEIALTRDGSTEVYCDTLGLTMEECDRLIDMINVMLTISEADSGTVDYLSGTVDLAAVAAEGADLFLPVAEERRLSLTAEPPEGPALVRGRLSLLQRVVANLLDNAIKFTPPGGSITVAVSRRGDDVLVAVRDTGSGIPAADLPRIFDRFYRADASRTMPGNGLGLSYVQAVVKAHHGRLEVDSTEGQGTTVRVFLPATPAAPTA